MRLEKDISERLDRTEKTLRKMFGTPVWRRKDPLDELVLTILSQNTNDRNRDVAFTNLKRIYPDWHLVMDAEESELIDVLRSAGLAIQKSRRIKSILRWVSNTFGGLTLDAIRFMNDDEAIKLLTSQIGIGVKTASVVLAFAFDRDLCPVDTHVHRLAMRLGWINSKDTPEKAFYKLHGCLPKNRSATFHLNLLKFGRTICTARNPNCAECPFWHECVYEKKKQNRG